MLYRQPTFLDAHLCAQVRAAMDAGSAEPAEILDQDVERRDDVRHAASIDIDEPLVAEIERRLDGERAAIERCFGVRLPAREGAAFLRYPPGGFYKPHRDRGDLPSWPDAARRAIALVVFLNDSGVGGNGGFDGGVLRLFVADHTLDVVPSQGLLVAFAADTLHEVTVVNGGVRDTIVDWFYDTRP